jgi:hypothetical protein
MHESYILHLLSLSKCGFNRKRLAQEECKLENNFTWLDMSASVGLVFSRAVNGMSSIGTYNNSTNQLIFTKIFLTQNIKYFFVDISSYLDRTTTVTNLRILAVISIPFFILYFVVIESVLTLANMQKF